MPEVLFEISRQENIKVFLPGKDLDTLKISINLQDLGIEDAFEKILDPVGYSAIKYDEYNYVVVKKAPTAYTPTLNSGRMRANVTIGSTTENPSKGPVNISGYIKDAKNGETIIGALVYATDIDQGTVSNPFGFYSIDVPYGIHELKVSFIGYEDEYIDLNALSTGVYDVEVFESSLELEEIVVTAEAEDINVQGAQAGITKLSIQTIKNIPAFFGEVDLVKTMTLVPGVSTVGEGASGFNVRGGDVSQNLLLLDDALIFNSSHLFGFFSVFHPDMVKDVTLYKGGIPSYYGGRLSSVMDVRLKEGNSREIQAKGGIGLLASKLAVEGPLNKGKGSFVFGGRASYINWLLKKSGNLNLVSSRGGYYDLTGKATYTLNKKDKLFLSAYLSHDGFRLSSQDQYDINNSALTLRWNHSFGKNLFSGLSLITGATSTAISNDAPLNTYTMTNGLSYQNIKFNMYYTPGTKHKIDIGANGIYHTINPGEYYPDQTYISEDPVDLETDRSFVGSLYLSDEITFNNIFSLVVGVRASFFSKTGEGSSYVYLEDVPKSPVTIIDTLNFKMFEPIVNFGGIEPRASMKFSLTPFSSLKFSYHRMYQYLHLVSNTAAITPLDFWISSNRHLAPQRGDQVSLGFFNNLFANMVETSVEGYYKDLANVVDYKEGGNILFNETLEADLLSGKGRAYGIETTVRKKSGKLNGWVGYTWSRSERLFAGKFPEETINQGMYYPSGFDKPHDIVVVANYSFTKRARISGNFVYSTGRPVTVPISMYRQDQFYGLLDYSERNQYRIPDYHRLDISFTLDEGHRRNRKFKGSWNFSIYNLYARKNAFSVFFDTRGNAYRLSVLGAAMPSISYNFSMY